RERLADELEDYQAADRVLTAALERALGGATERTTTPAAISPLPPPSEADWTALALAHRPLLKALTAQLDTEALSAALARVDGRPDVNVWVGYRIRTVETETDPGSDLVSVGVGVPLPIGSARRADSAEAAAQDRARGVEHTYQAALNDINAEMTTIHAAWVRASSKAETYREHLIPGAQAVLETTRSDFSVGRADFASLFEAEVALLTLERVWLMAATETHLQHAEVIGVLGVSPLGDQQ
ncbi:MAG: outer membrane protein TolC, partial [Myxococcota bacterium]